MKWVLVSLVVFAAGCNIFGVFYDEGESDDLDDVVGDVQAALERGDPGAAYRYAMRGLELYPESLSLLYLGSLAKAQENDVTFVDFVRMIRQEDEEALASRILPLAGTQDTTFFLQLSPEDLARLAESFSISYSLLARAVEIINEGQASPSEVREFESDITLGLGISGLLTAIFTVIDEDHDLSNGFELHPNIRAFETEEGWGFTAVADSQVICDAFDEMLVAQEALYDHYRSVVGLDEPEDIPPDSLFAELPWIDEETLSGEFFAAVHRGIISLHEDYRCKEVGR